MNRTLLALIIVLAGCAPTMADEGTGFAKAAPEGVRSVAVEGGFLVPYTATIPGTDVTFEMVPIPGGVVRLGLPEGETFASTDDDDVSRPAYVRVAPYWIGKCEVSWAEYWRFMELNSAFAKIDQLRRQAREASDSQAATVAALKRYDQLWATVNTKPTYVDGVTSPTPLYDSDMTYQSGEDPRLPAVSMTRYAARQYTKWLSRISGVEYRLPSEAEWEHAARADNEALANLAEAAWHDQNADYAAHPVGQLKPNAWGLHDMLGNAAELVLDAPGDMPASSPEAPLAAVDAMVWPTEAYPHIAKGGYWDASAEQCRPAARLLSQDWWKSEDPNLPKSPWWFSDAPAFGVGFRVLRPLKPMDERMKQLAWEIDNPDLKDDVENRLSERRGKLGVVDKHLPEVLKHLDTDEINALIE